MMKEFFIPCGMWAGRIPGTFGVGQQRLRRLLVPLRHGASYNTSIPTQSTQIPPGQTKAPNKTKHMIPGSPADLFEQHVAGRRVNEAKKIFLTLVDQSQRIPIRPLRALIKMIAHENQPDEALRLLRRAGPLHDTANEDLYRPIFLKFSQAGRPLEMVQLCHELRTSLSASDLSRSLNMTLASLVRKNVVTMDDSGAFVACPQHKSASQIEEFLRMVESADLRYDTYLFNALLLKCIDQKRDALFSQLFSRLRKTSRPDIVSFTLLLRSYMNRDEPTKISQLPQILRNYPNLQLDEEFLASLVQALMQHGHSDQVTTLLRQIATKDSMLSVKEGVNEFRVCSKAMTILLKNGREELGQRLFDYVRKHAESVPPPVLTSIYNQMLDYYGARDATISMKKVIESMEQHYNLIQWDHFTVTTILKYPDTFPGILSTADEFVLANPQSVDMPLLNGMIKANKRLGHYDRALEIFDELCAGSSDSMKHLSPDHFSYDNAVACCLAQGDHEKAKRLIEEMESRFPSHGIARAALIAKHCEALEFEKATNEVDAALEKFSMPDQRVELFIPFLRSYAKLGNMKKIDATLQWMKEVHAWPLQVSGYNVLLSYYARAAPERMDSLLQEMEEQGIRPMKETYDIVESYLYRSGSMDELERWQQERAQHGIPPSLESYNQKIKYLVESSTVFEAEKVISEMKSQGVHPTSSSYEPFLDYTSQHERLSSDTVETLRFRSKKASTTNSRAPASLPAFLEHHKNQPLDEVWNSMIKRGILLTAEDYDQLLFLYNQKGKFRNTVEFFSFMRKQNSSLIGPSHYRQLIFAYASLGLSGHVEKVMKGMDGMGIQPTVEDYNNLIFAFSQAKKFETAIVVYRQMEGQIQPDRGTFTRLIQGAAMAGRMTEAVEFFTEMKLHGFAPNLNAFLSLIYGYAKGGEIDLMIATYESMEGNQVAPDYRILHMLLEAFVASVPKQEETAQPLESDVALLEEQQQQQETSTSSPSHEWLSTTHDHAKFIMDEMERLGIEPDDILASTVLKYYLLSNRLRAALEAVDRLSQYKYIKPTALYVMLFCHYQQKDPEIVTNLIRRMRASGIEMDRHLRTFMHTPNEGPIARWRFLIRADLPPTYFAEQYQEIH